MKPISLMTAALTGLLVMCAGCASLRFADYVMPAVRLDRATNKSLPARDDPAVRRAMATWREMSDDERRRFPTPYHVYVDTPAPGTFEGAYTVGLAFSGGGTRGTVFGAGCVKALAALGDIVVEAADGPKRVNLLGEVDYVSGASTGAIPAAAFALNYGPSCPTEFCFDQWPACFNEDVTAYVLRGLALRPDWALRDFALGVNTRPIGCGALAAVFFEGKRFHPDSGLTFGDLPQTPVLVLPASIINDPGTQFMQTRLCYRYALDSQPRTPWGVGVQSFESFHTDPMEYALGEACYNSLSFPANMRSGLMTVRPDRSWVTEDLPAEDADRMRRARRQPGYAHTYEVKDGGLADNRGVYAIGRLFERLHGEGKLRNPPLLICLNAGWLELRPVKKGSRLFKKGWFDELASANLTSWQTGQDAFLRLVEAYGSAGAFAYAPFRYTAWAHYLRPRDPSAPEGPYMAAEDTREGRYLLALCREKPEIGAPQRLLEVSRGIGTRFGDLTEQEIAAVDVSVAFALWLGRDKLLQWASDCHAGAPARFAYAPTGPLP